MDSQIPNRDLKEPQLVLEVKELYDSILKCLVFLGLSSLAEMILQTQTFSLLISLYIYHVDVHIIRKGGRQRVMEGGKRE